MESSQRAACLPQFWHPDGPCPNGWPNQSSGTPAKQGLAQQKQDAKVGDSSHPSASVRKRISFSRKVQVSKQQRSAKQGLAQQSQKAKQGKQGSLPQRKNKTRETRNTDFKIGTLNVCSLTRSGRFEEIAEYIRTLGVDILAVTEVRREMTARITDSNSVWVPCKNSNPAVGGVGFLVAKHLSPYIQGHFQSHDDEAWLELMGDSRRAALSLSVG